MTAPAAFDPAMFAGVADVLEQPAVIAWEALDGTDYRQLLVDLASWVDYLVPLYRIPATVLPPCWYRHPPLVEELGHLWTGWQVTRHPQSGVGMIALDWDVRREQVITRMREITATCGCSGTRHVPDSPSPWRTDHAALEDHLAGQVDVRNAAAADEAAADGARAILESAERRHDRAAELLGTCTNDPAHATDDEIATAADAMRVASDEAVPTAAAAALAAGTRIEPGAVQRLTRARHALVEHLAATRGQVPDRALVAEWIAALDQFADPHEAITRAAAAARARQHAATRLATERRHSQARELLSRPGQAPRPEP